MAHARRSRRRNPPPAGAVFLRRERDGESILERWQYRGSVLTLDYGEAGDAELNGPIEDIEGAMNEGGGVITAYVRGPSGTQFVVEDLHGDNMSYDDRDAAFADVAKIADVIADAPKIRMPSWGTEDAGKYLRWFLTQQPNQANYVALFESNDHNGQYTGLLLEPIAESETVFKEMFGEYLTEHSEEALRALAAINRDRARKGQSRLDPESAGWSDEDLVAEAKRLRLANPSDADLELARTTVRKYGHLSAAQWRQRLPGGKARNKGPRDFPQTALVRGTAVELEHTTDPCTAMEIAMDHLAESPFYYDNLARVHPENPQANAAWIKPDHMYRYERHGETSYFYATERLKSGGWRGTLVRDYGRSESRGPLKHTIGKYDAEIFHEIPLLAVPETERRRFEKAGLTFPTAATNPTEVLARRLARGHVR